MKISYVNWNFAGLVFPLLIAAISIPTLLERLGNERFGLLTLAWGLVGYSSFLDLGVGRALTQMVSRQIGEEKLSDIPNLLATAQRITIITGLAAMILIMLAAFFGGANSLKVTEISINEITISMVLIALVMPFQSMSAVYKGINEAFLNFRGINLLRIGLGAITFCGPVIMSSWTVELPWLVLTLLLSRVIALSIYQRLAYSCLNINEIKSNSGVYEGIIARSLISVGGWLTVSIIFGFIMTQADRFLIAFILSASAVAAYTIPYEVVVQSLIFVGAITSVMFPVLSKLMYEKNSNWKKYFRRYLYLVCSVMLLICVLGALLLPFLLKVWLKNNIQEESILIGQILLLGVYANSIGSMYYALLHAQGRMDITAKFHVLEMPIYIIFLLLLLDQIGVIGAAWAWSGRMVIDALLLVSAVELRSKYLER